MGCDLIAISLVLTYSKGIMNSFFCKLMSCAMKDINIILFVKNIKVKFVMKVIDVMTSIKGPGSSCEAALS